jgi:hypothetical protein
MDHTTPVLLKVLVRVWSIMPLAFDDSSGD